MRWVLSLYHAKDAGWKRRLETNNNQQLISSLKYAQTHFPSPNSLKILLGSVFQLKDKGLC